MVQATIPAHDDAAKMKAIYINEYVKDLDDITPTIIPVPTIATAETTPKSSLTSTNDSRQETVLIRVRIHYTSPTHVDTLYARGLHQNNHAKLVHPPFVLGTEFSGVIDEIYYLGSASSSVLPSRSRSRSGVKEEAIGNPPRSLVGREFKTGDRVWGTALGAFAAYVLCSPTGLHHVPEQMSLFDAAGLGASTLPVSYGALIRLAQLRKGETCLVHAAAGGLGVAAVMIAKAVGANVIGTVGSQRKAEVVGDLLRRDDHGSQEKLGGNGDDVVRYDREGWEKEVLKLTNGKGVDVVFDTVGLVGKSIRCCRFGGRIIIVGFVGRGEGKNGVMEQVAMNRILLKGVKVLGYRYGESARRSPTEAVELWQGLNDLFSTTTIKPVIYRHYSGVDSIPRALKELSGREVYGKIIIEITDEDRSPTGESRSIQDEKMSKL